MIIDLSHTIEAGMPVYPGSLQPEFFDLELFNEHGVFVQTYKLDGHVGTHVDVPAHLFADGKSTVSKEISAFVGTAQVVDCTQLGGKNRIGTDRLDGLKRTDLPDFILFHTEWDRKWGTETYFDGYPVISEALMDILVETDIKGIGIDAISLDLVDALDLPNHKKILGADKIIIENLTNLQKLKGKRFQFSCFPLKFSRGDGSPVRAVAMLD